MVSIAAANMREHRLKMLMLQDQKRRQKEKGPSRLFKVEEPTVDASHSSPTEKNIELRLSSQLDQLKEIRAMDKKIEFKREWLPDYYGYIDAVLSQSPAPQNNVLLYLMVWLIDTHDFDRAVKIAQFAILNNMVMPSGFTRTIAEVIAEEIGELCGKDQALAQQHSQLLQNIAAIIQGEDLVNEAHAKIYKAIGIALKDVQPKDALGAFKTALRLHDSSGVKTFIGQLERLLAKQANESIHDTQSDSHDVSKDTAHASTAHQSGE